MVEGINTSMIRRHISLLGALLVALCLLLGGPVAADIGSQQNPQSGTVGLAGTVPGNPPTQAPTISVPKNGQVFTSTPITVSGLCQTDLLVKVFSNNIFVGSTQCVNGSYSLKIDLFSGRNDLVARMYDSFDQAGPDSAVVTITFNDAQFAQFGSHVSISSNYARRGADPGTALTWPLILSGGTGPYALSVDWGDGTSPDLQSIAFPGVITVSHTYTQSGVYTIVIKATDANRTSAYLQVVGVANGKVNGGLSAGTTVQPSGGGINPWWIAIVSIPLLIIAFWLGRRHELYSIRRSLEAGREQA